MTTRTSKAATSKTTTSKATTSRRKTVSFDELRELTTRRGRSSYPQDARTERQYWLRQIATLLGENNA